MTTQPRTRLQDVAERAGVSMKTVSNVIHDFPHVRTETRGRVQQAIDELGYQPNLSARNLALGRSGMIALAVPQVDMPYFAALSREIIDLAQQRGWVVVIEQTFARRCEEERVVEARFAQRIDGVIFSPSTISTRRIERRDDQTPLVLLGDRAGRLVADHVEIDNVAAARCAVEHLLSLPRHRVALIGPKPNLRFGRFRGYHDALVAAGLSVDLGLTRAVSANIGAKGEAAMTDLLAAGAPPDAVFCATDWLALGALRSLQRHGLRVPEDVAVVGFDDIPYGQASTPSLTTIRPNRRQIAQLALDALDRQFTAKRRPAPVNTIAAFELVPRESTLGR